MIRSFEIENFKCIEHRRIDDCKLINVIVGDNGAGKTSLLEAIFLALASSSEVAQRYRQQRGVDGYFAGQIKQIEEALWRDLFFQQDWNRELTIKLYGEGPEHRSVRVFRSASNFSVPVADVPPLPFSETGMADRIGPVTFAWMNSEGREFLVRPIITKGKIDFPSTEEEMPDFFYFSSNSPTGSVDVATRFSELRRNGGIQLLNQAIGSAFPWIRDMQVEVIAGSPILYADDARRNVRLPVAMMSGAVNRTLAILLSIAARKNAVVLVDEMENGIFYKNYRTIWAAIIGFCKIFNTQLFTTTHSLEWLRALFDETPNDLKDLIAVWRVEQDLEGPQIYPFSGSVAADIIDFGSDLRSGADNE